jgi:hypothetical protein
LVRNPNFPEQQKPLWEALNAGRKAEFQSYTGVHK